MTPVVGRGIRGARCCRRARNSGSRLLAPLRGINARRGKNEPVRVAELKRRCSGYASHASDARRLNSEMSIRLPGAADTCETVDTVDPARCAGTRELGWRTSSGAERSAVERQLRQRARACPLELPWVAVAGSSAERYAASEREPPSGRGNRYPSVGVRPKWRPGPLHSTAPRTPVGGPRHGGTALREVPVHRSVEGDAACDRSTRRSVPAWRSGCSASGSARQVCLVGDRTE